MTVAEITRSWRIQHFLDTAKRMEEKAKYYQREAEFYRKQADRLSQQDQSK